MKLNELKEYDEDVYRKAYEKWAVWQNNFDDWWEDVYDWMKEQGKERGFNVEEIEFSGFCSQGDGARWKGSIDVYKWLQGQEWWKGRAHWSIYGELNRIGLMGCGVGRFSSNYSNDGSMWVEVEWGEMEFGGYDDCVVEEGLFQGLTYSEAYEILEPHTQDIEDTLLEAARDFAREIYRTLEEEYEYQTSEEAFAEWAECNEIEFDEKGEWV